jgi:hypothetical protein
MIPAAQAVRSLLALKLIGAERKSHVMDLVVDQSIALFAGINAVPKRSYLAAYSSRIDHKICLRFMEAWLDQVEQAGLPHGAPLSTMQLTLVASSRCTALWRSASAESTATPKPKPSFAICSTSQAK